MENKRTYKIIASDLDGTFLRDDQTISAENLIALEEFYRRGIEFVPITGRTLSEVPKEIMDSSYVRYIVCSDGTIVWDKVSRDTVVTHYMPNDISRIIVDAVRKYGAYPLVHINGDNHYDIDRHTPEFLKSCNVDEYFVRIVEKHSRKLADYDNYVIKSDNVEMFTIFFGDMVSLEKCRRIFLETGKLCVAQSAPNNLEVYPYDAGKGKAILELAEILGVDVSEVIAVGDSTNDVSLVKTAGLGLAMENACDELKSIADMVICKNSEHNAKYILENFIMDKM